MKKVADDEEPKTTNEVVVDAGQEQHSRETISEKEFQEGVQRVRAITASWTKTTLWITFTLSVLPDNVTPAFT